MLAFHVKDLQYHGIWHIFSFIQLREDSLKSLVSERGERQLPADEEENNTAFICICFIVNMVEILKEMTLSVWTETLNVPPLYQLPTQGLPQGLYETPSGANIIDAHVHTHARTVCMLWAVCALCCWFPAALHRAQRSFPSTCPSVITHHTDLLNDCQEIRSLLISLQNMQHVWRWNLQTTARHLWLEKFSLLSLSAEKQSTPTVEDAEALTLSWSCLPSVFCAHLCQLCISTTPVLQVDDSTVGSFQLTHTCTPRFNGTMKTILTYEIFHPNTLFMIWNESSWSVRWKSMKCN